MKEILIYNIYEENLADENFLMKEELKKTQNEIVELKFQTQKMEKEKKKNILDMEQLTLSFAKIKEELEQRDNQIKGFFIQKEVDENNETKENFKKVIYEKELFSKIEKK